MGGSAQQTYISIQMFRKNEQFVKFLNDQVFLHEDEYSLMLFKNFILRNNNFFFKSHYMNLWNTETRFIHTFSIFIDKVVFIILESFRSGQSVCCLCRSLAHTLKAWVVFHSNSWISGTRKGTLELRFTKVVEKLTSAARVQICLSVT